MQLLLRHPNCDVTNPDDDGITALTFCSKYVRIKNDKHAIRLRSMLEYSQVDTNAQASEGSTALHVACKAGGQPDVAVQLFLVMRCVTSICRITTATQL